MKLKHDSLKHPQTIGVVERSHSALKRILKLNTDEKWTTWYKYTDLATFIHNTSYHSILKNRYPERSNRRIPVPSNDVHSASFQLNMFADPNDCIRLPMNIRIKPGSLLANQNLRFAHCVSSNLSMSAGIATLFIRLFPQLKDVRAMHSSLQPGSLIAHFSRQHNIWIYNLVTKANHRQTDLC